MSQESEILTDHWGNSPLALRFPLFPIIEDEHSCSESCDCKDERVQHDEDELTIGITSFTEEEEPLPQTTLILPDISRWEGKSNFDFHSGRVNQSIHLVDVSNFLGDEVCHDADDEDEEEVITLPETMTKYLKSQVEEVVKSADLFQTPPQNGMFLEAMEMLSQASYSDLAFEWSMLCQDCPECWTTTGKIE